MWLVRRYIGCVKIRTWLQLLRCVALRCLWKSRCSHAGVFTWRQRSSAYTQVVTWVDEWTSRGRIAVERQSNRSRIVFVTAALFGPCNVREEVFIARPVSLKCGKKFISRILQIFISRAVGYFLPRLHSITVTPVQYWGRRIILYVVAEFNRSEPKIYEYYASKVGDWQSIQHLSHELCGLSCSIACPSLSGVETAALCSRCCTDFYIRSFIQCTNC